MKSVRIARNHAPGSEGCVRVGQFSEVIGNTVDHSSELDKIEVVPESVPKQS